MNIGYTIDKFGFEMGLADRGHPIITTEYNGHVREWKDRHGNTRYTSVSYYEGETFDFWSITGAKHWLCLIHMVKRPPARNPTDGQIKMYSPTPQELATIYG